LRNLKDDNGNLLKCVDNEGFLLDEDGIQIKDIFNLEPIHYENAILLNKFIYDKENLIEWAYKNLFKDPFTRQDLIKKDQHKIRFIEILKMQQIIQLIIILKHMKN